MHARTHALTQCSWMPLRRAGPRRIGISASSVVRVPVAAAVTSRHARGPAH
jgi:hypothetical protein